MMDRNERIRILAPYPLLVKDQSAIEEAIIGAVNDMKKLETIEQIVTDDYGYLSSYSKIKDIKEVLYGNND
jgi:hypothetical protein